MMTIKTRTIKHRNAKMEDYINIPVIDRITSYIDFNEGVINGNDNSKVIGVITNAEDIGNGEIELTITLWKNKFQGEYIRDLDGFSKPTSFSMGYEVKNISNQKERAEKFLEELTELSRKYGFEVTAEGTSPLLYDNKKRDWIAFGKSFSSDKYKIYE